MCGVPLSKLTSFRIGGPAAIVFRPHTENELVTALAAAKELDFPFVVLGNGTNVLAPDAGYDGMVVRFDRAAQPPVFHGQSVTAEAQTRLSDLAEACIGAGLMGLECMGGIPGTVGGACAMNAGAYGQEVRDTLRALRVYRDGEIADVTVREGDLGFRTSRFSAPDTIVLRATFSLSPDDGGARRRAMECAVRRSEKQPLTLPSAGSVFKRPAGNFAGTLIERCGLKGTRAGGAEVSALHANFIVNTGGATEQDVRALVRLVQQRVEEQTGIRLERELKYFSEV